VIVDATKVGYAPLLAQALYWRGRASADRGGVADAEEHVRQDVRHRARREG
jgi:hypothetical protein